MKSIILFFLFTLISFYTTFSRELIFFKAKDGQQPAVTAVYDSGFVDPEPIAILSPEMIIVYDNTQIKVGPDLHTGMANCWIYLFRSIDNHDCLFAIALINDSTHGGFIPIQIDPQRIISEWMPIDYETTLTCRFWYDSDQIINEFKKDKTGVISFLEQNPNPDKLFYGLMVNSNYSQWDNDTPIWMIRAVSGNETQACAVNAVTKTDHHCFDVTEVKEEISLFNDYSIFPNPADEFISISKNLISRDGFDKVEIYDLFGDILLVNNYLNLGINVNLNLNLKELNPGYYFIKIKYNNKYVIKPFIIKR